MPYTPCGPYLLLPSVLFPPIQVHWSVEGSISHRSLRRPQAPLASKPSPPKSQRLPLLSVQAEASERPPGMFPAAGTPSVPYTPCWPHNTGTAQQGSPRSRPPIQAHSFVEGSNSQRSLRVAQLPMASKPWPPKSQKLPLLSVQAEAPERPPGMFPAAGTPNVPYTPGGQQNSPEPG